MKVTFVSRLFATLSFTDNGRYLFFCMNFKSADLHNLDTSKVPDLTYMFSGCETLTVLDISGTDYYSAWSAYKCVKVIK